MTMTKASTQSKTAIQPYLLFPGRCEEALEFYRTAIGAQVEGMMRFEDSPEPPEPGMLPPGSEKKILHAAFRVGDTLVMASDYGEQGSTFSGFSLALAVHTEADADRYFNALAKGGSVIMPLGKTFWSPRFGMLTDRFGVAWMINLHDGKAG
jgi:PhnB protein